MARWWWKYDRLKPVVILCSTCSHLHFDGETCDAFPYGIPDRYIHNGEEHRSNVPGDRGIAFEPWKSQEDYRQFLDKHFSVRYGLNPEQIQKISDDFVSMVEEAIKQNEKPSGR